MRRSLSIFASSLAAVMIGPLTPASSQEYDPDVWVTYAESSAIQSVTSTPLLVDPSIGYALSQSNQEPKSEGKASVVEPGLVGRVALYTYGKRVEDDGSVQPGIIEVPLSSECAYPDPPGPQQVSQSATQQPPSKEKQEDADTGAAIAICRSYEAPGLYAHTAAGAGVVDGVLSFASLAATSLTEKRSGQLAVSESRARVTGISIGEVLTIDEIISEISAVSGATAEAEVTEAKITIVGAMVQGQRVAITEAGVVVVDPQPGTSLADAQKQVDEALAAASVTVRLVRAQKETPEEGKVAAYSGGVLVRWEKPEAEKAQTFILGQSQGFAKFRR